MLAAAKTLATDSDGNSALHRCKTAEEAEGLIGLGLDVNAKNNDGLTPLHLACWYGYSGVVSRLLAAGAEVNARRKISGRTPLHFACQKNHPEVVSQLLDAGAELGVKIKFNGWTPLHYACRWGHPDVVTLLLAAGAPKDAKSRIGCTPLHESCRHGNPQVVILLLAAGAEINALNNDYWAPLHEASSGGHPKVVTALLAAGALTDVKNVHRKTPFDLCGTDEMRALFKPKLETAQNFRDQEAGSENDEARKKADMSPIRPLLGVVARAHTLLKAADDLSIGTSNVDANALYQSALALLKTATRQKESHQ